MALTKQTKAVINCDYFEQIPVQREFCFTR